MQRRTRGARECGLNPWVDVEAGIRRTTDKLVGLGLDLDCGTYDVRPPRDGAVRLTQVAAMATAELDKVRLSHPRGFELDGWRVDVWQPECVILTREIVLVAIDPMGRGHSIEALAHDGQ